MPEGPEVTIIREGLSKLLKNKTVYELNILPKSPYEKKAPDNYIAFCKELPLKVLDVENKGKFIYWKFEKHFYMSVSLGMSGIWEEKKDKHSTFEVVYGSKPEKKIYLTDQRKFAKIKFYLNKTELDEKLNTLGPDILNDKDLTFAQFKKRLHLHPRWNITKALMDQCTISGIGNYLKSESLYDAKISPHRTVESLSNEELETLFKSCRKIIKDSYRNQGVSIRNYVDVDGKKGSFEFKLKVYGRKLDPDGNKVVKETTKDGRTTHWVPEVQK